jgi:signal transduction histidine kinase
VQRKHLTETLMLGAAIMLIFFNLLYFLWTKERNHLYFVFYNTTIVFYSFFYLRGYSVLLPVTSIELLTEYAYCLGATANLAAVLFSRDFLKPYPNRKWMEPVLNVYIGYLILIILCNAIGYRQISGVLLVISGILTPFIISLNASFPARDGHKAAIALLIGWLIAGFGMIIYSLSIASKIPFHWITMALLPLSTALVDLLVLTYAVAIRHIKLTNEKDQWKEMLLKSMDERRKELEYQVEERTKSLLISNQLLQESNAVKNRMISLITHDLKMPLVNLQAILDLLTGNLLTVEQSQRKLNDVKHSLGEISGLLENLLLWSKQQQKNIRTQISPLDLSHIIEDTTPFVRLLFTQKDMTLQLAVEKTRVHADAFQLETILRNLLYNAGQNAARGSVVRIGQMKIHNRFCVFVENEGQTLTVEAFEQLMQQAELFRNEINQLHTGIGLQLCAEFLLNHGSKLKLESNDQFTRFYFYLPEPS